MKKEDALQQATQVLVQEQTRRVEAAAREIQAALERHRVTLEVYTVLQQGSVIHRAELRPAEGWAGDPGRRTELAGT